MARANRPSWCHRHRGALPLNGRHINDRRRQVHRHYTFTGVQHLRLICRLRHWPQYSARKPRRHRQSQWPQAQAVVFAQILRFGDEHSGILRRLLRSGVLPRHIQRPQPRHYASCRYAIKTSIVASNLLRS